MHLDRAEIHDEQQRREVLHHHVADDAVLAVLALDGTSRDPVGRVRRRRLLVEEGPVHAVGHALHRERPVMQVRQDQLGDVVVEREQVALRVALVGPEHLVEVREPELAAVGLHPPGVAALLGRQRSRERDRERADRSSSSSAATPRQRIGQTGISTARHRSGSGPPRSAGRSPANGRRSRPGTSPSTSTSIVGRLDRGRVGRSGDHEVDRVGEARRETRARERDVVADDQGPRPRRPCRPVVSISKLERSTLHRCRSTSPSTPSHE